MSWRRRLLRTRLFRPEVSPWAIILRFAVGFVFLTEGLNKFINPDERGPGRFEGLGFPAPELVANAIGVVEVLAGSMLILGFLTRFAAIFLAGVALNAIVLTKLPVLLGAPIGPFTGVDASFYGVWGFLYEWRLDFAMFMGSIYLVAAGPDRRSLDAYLFGEEPVLTRLRSAVRSGS
jgi:putative oxidoreductase